MSEFIRINAPRVEKIVAALSIIDKSALSNGATAEEISALLMPISWRFAGLAQTPKSAPAGRPDIVIADAAREAPLRDLVRAMAVLLNRIDEEML